MSGWSADVKKGFFIGLGVGLSILVIAKVAGKV